MLSFNYCMIYINGLISCFTRFFNFHFDLKKLYQWGSARALICVLTITTTSFVQPSAIIKRIKKDFYFVFNLSQKKSFSSYFIVFNKFRKTGIKFYNFWQIFKKCISCSVTSIWKLNGNENLFCPRNLLQMKSNL